VGYKNHLAEWLCSRRNVVILGLQDFVFWVLLMINTQNYDRNWNNLELLGRLRQPYGLKTGCFVNCDHVISDVMAKGFLTN
jgi:hypothetical protein